MIVDDYVTAELQNVTTLNDSAAKTMFLKFSFDAPNAIQRQGDLYFLTADPFKIFENWNWMIYDKRKYPVDFKYPYTLKKTIDIRLDKGLNARNLPKNQKLYTEHLFYNKQIETVSTSHWKCSETFYINNTAISPSEYPEARKFFQQLKAGIDEKTVLSLNP